MTHLVTRRRSGCPLSTLLRRNELCPSRVSLKLKHIKRRLSSLQRYLAISKRFGIRPLCCSSHSSSFALTVETAVLGVRRALPPSLTAVLGVGRALPRSLRGVWRPPHLVHHTRPPSPQSCSFALTVDHKRKASGRSLVPRVLPTLRRGARGSGHTPSLRRCHRAVLYTAGYEYSLDSSAAVLAPEDAACSRQRVHAVLHSRYHRGEGSSFLTAVLPGRRRPLRGGISIAWGALKHR